MTTRREFIKSVPAMGAAFAVAGRVYLDDAPARAQGTAPLEGHFHPEGKPPSKSSINSSTGRKATP